MTPQELAYRELKEHEAAMLHDKPDKAGRRKGIRRCRICGEYKPATLEYFPPNKYNYKDHKHKLAPRCLECGEYNRAVPRGGYESKSVPSIKPDEFVAVVDQNAQWAALAARMMRLLEEVSPYLNGDGYKVDDIKQEYERLL